MVDKNLFPYDLAIVAVFKDEAPYLREWLDYHLLAGVEHFYLYNNDSTDAYAEVIKPYVAANLVTLIDWPGKLMQMPAYNDALERLKFLCRYMAFVDIDEFIFPKTSQSIVEVVDEVLSRDETAAALAINWQCFGSNGHERADYSRGVLERFTRRAPSDWFWERGGNFHVKTIANPRAIDYCSNPHFMIYFDGFRAVDEKGSPVEKFYNLSITVDKIAVNHYYTKSRGESLKKIARGRSDIKREYDLKVFAEYDRNEVFDDDILTYRAIRAKNFSLTDEAQRFARAEKVLIDTLTAQSPFDAPTEFFNGKLETFLTCRKLAEVFGTRIGNRSAEEYALVWIYQTLTRAATATYAEIEMFLRELPEILSRPSALTEKILRLTCDRLIPAFGMFSGEQLRWDVRTRLFELKKFLMLLR